MVKLTSSNWNGVVADLCNRIYRMRYITSAFAGKAKCNVAPSGKGDRVLSLLLFLKNKKEMENFKYISISNIT